MIEAATIFAFCTLFSNHLINGLVVTETRFLSQSGRNWVLTDEPFSISCHWLLQKEMERPSSIEILKDDRQVSNRNFIQIAFSNPLNAILAEQTLISPTDMTRNARGINGTTE